MHGPLELAASCTAELACKTFALLGLAALLFALPCLLCCSCVLLCFDRRALLAFALLGLVALLLLALASFRLLGSTRWSCVLSLLCVL